jgi:methylenetetrahydrofolate--tRNA-(uracil-5-)-methyltransferase
LLAGMQAAAMAVGTEPVAPPRATAMGALVNYICQAEGRSFQPANITFDLLQPLDEATRRRVRDKKQRHAMVCERALAELQNWLDAYQTLFAASSDVALRLN